VCPWVAASGTWIRAASRKFESATLNNPNRRSPTTGFFNDFTREYTQSAAFASVDFDIIENLTLTLGTRYYDIENSFRGANMGSFGCKVYGNGLSGPCPRSNGTNVDEQPDNTNTTDGFRSRANLTWRITGDALVYATWSEGYRPGGFNRGSACGAKDPQTGINQWCFPTSYESDDLTNIEAGWKTSFWAVGRSSMARSTRKSGRTCRLGCSRRNWASRTCSPS